MGEVREAWCNVYHEEEHTFAGTPHNCVAEAEKWAAFVREEGGEQGPVFRIHVRLKPEGAPRRYASERHRQKWEANPGFMRHDEAVR